MEDIFNETFAGLTLLYRDTKLSENLISKYQVGQIIMERGFTDMTYKGGGLSTNFRYLIASAHGKDLSAINPEASILGHIVLTSNAYFKVLDIYKIGDKTQVFLLNIPERGIALFKSAMSNIEADIIQKARHNFDEKINLPIIEELKNQEWQERIGFPLGMNDNGEMFYTEIRTTPPNNNKASNVNTSKNHDERKPWWKIW